MTVINAWIEPGTTIISDCCSAYRNLGAQVYTHRTVNHTIAFINEGGDHTNTIESKWGHVKAYLKSYKRKEDYIYHFAHYMFAARFKAEGVNQFTNSCTLSRARIGRRLLRTPFYHLSESQ